jgi:Domain of unknown function (DUF6456)
MYGGDYNDRGKFVPNAIGEMRREVDPDGRITTHPVRISPYVHERLHSSGKLAHELYDAAEKFRIDFERAQLCGNYARLDMFKARSGRQEMSDGVMRAKIRINKALEALGRGKDGPNLLQSCAWSVVGLGVNLEGWTNMIRQAGAAMNADKASGILHGSLELIALHYGMINMGRIASLQNEKSYARGIKDALEFITVFAASTQGGEKNVICRLMRDMEKRFAKFA